MPKWRPDGWKEKREEEHARHVSIGYAGVELMHYDKCITK